MVKPASMNSQALSVYAAQEQERLRNRERSQENRPREETIPTGESKQGERVTLSQQAQQLAKEASSQNTTDQTGNPQAVERKQLERPEETRAAAAKSVAQAINAYRSNSNSLGI